MAERLASKVAVVTGAGSRGAGIGNGKAAAILFAREGARVLCVDTVASRAEETVRTIVDEGGAASVFEGDVSHGEGCQRMAQVALERYGRIDVLQNNVGIPSAQPLEEVTEDAWDQVMGVNVRSLVLAAQACVPVMAEGGGGSIINISSIAGLRAYPPRATAYTTSKAAVIGLTMALAGQLGGRRIRVNCIAPGQVYTPLVAERLDEAGRARRATSALIKDEGTAWDIAWAAVYLASDEARWVNGQVLTVDAGITITIPGNEYT
ncbi:MAG TPA: glucose 1-dehydrogenase [Chloroflexota bacterium]|jgi:NAD(P)-dependent dehydrogenase (short-subunit alcohol dehydrogenase family)|nr:glucose 1-dehydrogenase [Chloroflexota bacterium]